MRRSAAALDPNTNRRSGWLLVALKPGANALATANLVNQGYVVFSPHVRSNVRKEGNWSVEIMPLLPSHILVSDSASDRWQAVNSTFGVSKVVVSARRPVRIDADFVEALQSITRDDIIDFGLVQYIRASFPQFEDEIFRLEHLGQRDRLFVLLGFADAPR